MHSGVHFTNALPPTMGFLILPYLINPQYSGPIQWACGDVGLKPSAAVRPWALAGCDSVARNGFGPKAPPLAARLVPWNGRGQRLVEVTEGCYSEGDSQGLPG